MKNMDYFMEKSKSIKIWLNPYPKQRIEAFRVNGLGIHEKMKSGMVHRPNGTNDYLLMHFHTPVQAEVNGSMQSLPCHSFIIWRPGIPHHFGNQRISWLHSWIHCDGRILEAALRNAHLPLDRPIQLPNAKLTEKYLWEISSEISAHTRPDDVILENLLEIWIRQLSRHINADSQTAIPARLRVARLFLEQKLAGIVRLSEVAAAAHLSASHFSAEFKKYFGISPMRYLLELRLKQAAYRLQDINTNITETTRAVGFQDALYFSRQFKRLFGVSPRLYRQKNLRLAPQLLAFARGKTTSIE